MPFYVRETALKNRLDALFKLTKGKIYDTNAPGYRRNDKKSRLNCLLRWGLFVMLLNSSIHSTGTIPFTRKISHGLL